MAALGTLTGCGGGKTASVSGQVTYQGKPVTGGSLSFSPIPQSGEREPGKPGTATVGPDGNYEVGTYDEDDGAVIGKHQVSYSAPVLPFPEGKDPQPGEMPPQSGFEGLVPRVETVEVKPGQNTIDIELVPERR
jgi:hypothetical protein